MIKYTCDENKWKRNTKDIMIKCACDENGRKRNINDLMIKYACDENEWKRNANCYIATKTTSCEWNIISKTSKYIISRSRRPFWTPLKDNNKLINAYPAIWFVFQDVSYLVI